MHSENVSADLNGAGDLRCIHTLTSSVPCQDFVH